MTLIDTILLAALVGLLIAAYLDSRPHLQLLLAAILSSRATIVRSRRSATSSPASALPAP